MAVKWSELYRWAVVEVDNSYLRKIIYKMVYNLYDLSDEEIKIVEGAVKWAN